MKVRWTSDSIRFRITPGELDKLRTGGAVGISLRVPGGQWEATITPGDEESATELRGGGANAIIVYLAPVDLYRLCEEEREGVYFHTATEGITIQYFIEKDFPCVHPRPNEVQEESETFTPPSGFAERHKTVSC